MKPTCDFNRMYLNNLEFLIKRKRERESGNKYIIKIYKDIRDCEEKAP